MFVFAMASENRHEFPSIDFSDADASFLSCVAKATNAFMTEYRYNVIVGERPYIVPKYSKNIRNVFKIR